MFNIVVDFKYRKKQFKRSMPLSLSDCVIDIMYRFCDNCPPIDLYTRSHSHFLSNVVKIQTVIQITYTHRCCTVQLTKKKLFTFRKRREKSQITICSLLQQGKKIICHVYPSVHHILFVYTIEVEEEEIEKKTFTTKKKYYILIFIAIRKAEPSQAEPI